MTPGVEIRCQAHYVRGTARAIRVCVVQLHTVRLMREQNTLNAYNEGAETAPDSDPEFPRDVHDTHEWLQLPRWAECTVCGVRDYWAGASAECARPKKTGKQPDPPSLTLGLACARLRADIVAFELWWVSKNLGNERPSLAEFFAEFSEWRRVATANY